MKRVMFLVPKGAVIFCIAASLLTQPVQSHEEQELASLKNKVSDLEKRVSSLEQILISKLVSNRNTEVKDEKIEDPSERQNGKQGQESGKPLSEAIRQARDTIDLAAVLKDAIPRTALPIGGLQLSTYDWEYAPYLAYLKSHIGAHIYPPAAFTDLGLIDGETVVRFKIYKDGSLKDLEALKHQGSPLLRDTSVRAVKLSAVFKPLPPDFPDPYLEVTGIFEYVVFRNKSK